MGDGSSGTTGGPVTEGDTPESCANGQPVPGVYCFGFHNVLSVTSPKLAVGAQFTGSPPERFAAFGLGHTRAMIWWENGALAIGEEDVPPLTATAESQGVSINMMGSPEPELVVTHILTAGIAPNEGGLLKPFIPIDLPESAFAAPGHTIPLDIGEDGTIEYVKGSGDSATVWRKALNVWKMDVAKFPVPGCKTLMNFALADFNADGRTDLAYIGNAYTDSSPEKCDDLAVHGIIVLLQNELADLTAMPMLSTGQHRFLRVRAGDFDADGKSDISALTTSGDLLTFRSTGEGLFAPPQVLEGVGEFAIGDVDGDNRSEVIISTKATQDVLIADNIFDVVEMTKMKDFRGVPLAVGDLNQDNVEDIAFMSQVDDLTVLTVAISNP